MEIGRCAWIECEYTRHSILNFIEHYRGGCRNASMGSVHTRKIKRINRGWIFGAKAHGEPELHDWKEKLSRMRK